MFVCSFICWYQAKYIWLLFDTLYSFLCYFRKNLNLISVANKWILTWLRFGRREYMFSHRTKCLKAKGTFGIRDLEPEHQMLSGFSCLSLLSSFLCILNLFFNVPIFAPSLLLWLPATTELRKLQVRSFSLYSQRVGNCSWLPALNCIGRSCYYEKKNVLWT